MPNPLWTTHEESQDQKRKRKNFYAALVLLVCAVSLGVMAMLSTTHILFVQSPFTYHSSGSETVPVYPGMTAILNWTVTNVSTGPVKVTITPAANPTGNFTFTPITTDQNGKQSLAPGDNNVAWSVLVGSNVTPGNYTLSLSLRCCG